MARRHHQNSNHNNHSVLRMGTNLNSLRNIILQFILDGTAALNKEAFLQQFVHITERLFAIKHRCVGFPMQLASKCSATHNEY